MRHQCRKKESDTEAKEHGKSCLVIERRNHVGGNIYCENIEGIHVHKYGPHIFHTDIPKVWEYVKRFVEFNHFTYCPVDNYKGEDCEPDSNEAF